MQNRLQSFILDNRAEWQALWTENKESINTWYKEVYDKIIVDKSLSNLLKKDKVEITINNGIWSLPIDFYQLVNVYWKDIAYSYWDINNWYQKLEKEQYKIIIESWVYKIKVLWNIQWSLYIDYIPEIQELAKDTDIPNIPSSFHNDIVNYAIIDYHRQQRDWIEVSNSLQYAEWKIWEHIDEYWDE